METTAGSRPAAGLLERAAGMHPAGIAAAGVAVFVALSLPGLWRESSTYDEGIHLSAAFAATKGDRRWFPEHPPLGRVPAAIPLLLQQPALPDDPLLLAKEEHWGFGFRFLYQSGNDADRLLRSGRAAMLLWGIGLLIAVYVVARSTYGPAAGLVALTLMAFCPTLLAHGHLVTTDTAAACMVFLAATALEGWMRHPTWRSATGAGLLLGAALSVKYTALLLLPFLALRAVAAVLRGAPPGHRTLPGAGGVALVGVLSVGVIWATFGFRHQAASDPSFRYAPPPDRPGLAQSTIQFAQRYTLLPEAYLYGMTEHHRHQSEGHWAFAAGKTSRTGWWWYFPFCILVKTPVSALALFGWGLWAWYRRPARDGLKDDHLVLAVGVLLLGAAKATISIGIRHIFPVFPFLAVLAGGLVADGRRMRGAVPVLLAVAALEAVAGAPSYISYFNLPARAVAEPHDLLVDSNLDWGQDLALLKEYVDRHRIDRLKLGYFGTASPRHLGLRHERLPGLNVYEYHESEWKAAAGIEPGDVVAVSVTNLRGVYLNDKDYYRRTLEGLRPTAKIGGSILLYRIPP